jgi:hypothetical protein
MVRMFDYIRSEFRFDFCIEYRIKRLENDWFLCLYLFFLCKYLLTFFYRSAIPSFLKVRFPLFALATEV